MAATHRNRLVTAISNTPGSTGALTIAAAASGYRTFGAADDGLSFDVSIVDGTAWEIRTGCVYTHAGTSLARGTLEDSSIAGPTAVALTSAAVVTVTMSAGMGNDITSNLYADPLAVIPASGASVSQSARNLAVLDVTLTNNCAIGFADIPSGGAWSVKLIIRQDATGSRLATWPASTSWVKGVAPTLKTAASSVDLVELITTDGGSTWVGDYSTTPPTGTSTGAVGNLCVITNDGTTSQSLATNSATKIAAALPTVQSNIDGYWNTSTKEYKPTVAGKYLIMAAAQGIANSSLTAQIFKNGALESNGPAWAAYGYCSCAISTVVLMNGTTDYVDFRVFSTANTTINPAVGNTYFKAIFLGA